MSIKQTLSQTSSYQLGMAEMLCSRKCNALRQKILRQHDLTVMAWLVLGVIFDAHQAGGIRITELARRFNVKSTYITAIVNDLKQKNLVNAYIDKEDGRARLVVVTKKGVERVPVIDQELQLAMEEWFTATVSEKDLTVFLRTIQKFAAIQDVGTNEKPRVLDEGPFYHGTKADLRVGDLLTAGFKSNYRPEVTMNHIYFTALPNGAGLAAELSQGSGEPRVYIVEPLGSFENDPNVTDKKFPGNPTRSYRSKEPLRIVGEVTGWKRLTPEELQDWRAKLANIKGEILN